MLLAYLYKVAPSWPRSHISGQIFINIHLPILSDAPYFGPFVSHLPSQAHYSSWISPNTSKFQPNNGVSRACQVRTYHSFFPMQLGILQQGTRYQQVGNLTDGSNCTNSGSNVDRTFRDTTGYIRMNGHMRASYLAAAKDSSRTRL